MTVFVRKLVSVLLFVCLASLPNLCGCGESDDKGACVLGSGIGATCGDGFTAGQCDMMNGTLHKGDSCSDLGFSSI